MSVVKDLTEGMGKKTGADMWSQSQRQSRFTNILQKFCASGLYRGSGMSSFKAQDKTVIPIELAEIPKNSN